MISKREHFDWSSRTKKLVDSEHLLPPVIAVPPASLHPFHLLSYLHPRGHAWERMTREGKREKKWGSQKGLEVRGEGR